MDPGRTGNFEITVFTKEDLSDEGKPVYSKQGTGKFPHADASEFETLVNAITAATSWTWVNQLQSLLTLHVNSLIPESNVKKAA